MKNGFISLGMIAVLLLAGCGKKAHKKKNVNAASLSVDAQNRSDVLFAQAKEAEREFDLDAEEEMAEYIEDEMFAFADEYPEDLMDEDFAEEEAILAELEAAAAEAEGLMLEEVEDDYEFAPLTFSFNYDTVDSPAELVDANAELASMAAAEGRKIIIQGHADLIGSKKEDFNMELSLKRAEKVRDLFIAKGVPAESLEIVGFGSELPVVFSDAQEKETRIEDEHINRRVDFAVI